MGGKSPSDKLMSRKENEGLARNQPQKHGQNHAKIQHIGSIKDLRPQNTYSTNINHKGLQRTANEYAERRKDLISKNYNEVDIF